MNNQFTDDGLWFACKFLFDCICVRYGLCTKIWIENVFFEAWRLNWTITNTMRLRLFRNNGARSNYCFFVSDYCRYWIWLTGLSRKPLCFCLTLSAWSCFFGIFFETGLCLSILKNWYKEKCISKKNWSVFFSKWNGTAKKTGFIGSKYCTEIPSFVWLNHTFPVQYQLGHCPFVSLSFSTWL